MIQLILGATKIGKKRTLKKYSNSLFNSLYNFGGGGLRWAPAHFENMACEELPFQGLLFIIAVSRLFIFLPGAFFSQENSKQALKKEALLFLLCSLYCFFEKKLPRAKK